MGCSGGRSLDLPEAGIVVIQGANGSGKSSYVEASSVALFGKTLRGNTPWRKEPGETSIKTYEKLQVTRSKGAKINLSWFVDRKEVVYETTTKSQVALEKIIGSFDIWRRTSVLSSADASHFTLATDVERKRLIEGILGLDNFDPALTDCRVDLKNTQYSRARVQLDLDRVNQQVFAAQKRLGDVVAQLSTFPDTSLHINGDSLVLQQTISGLESELASNRARIRSKELSSAEGSGLTNHLKASLDAIRGDSCPTCTQPIGASLRAGLEAKIQELENTQRENSKAYGFEIQELQQTVDDLAREREELVKNLRKIQILEANKDLISKLKSQSNEAQQELCRVQGSFDKLAKELKILEISEASLSSTEDVLGMSGVRAHLLGNSLKSVEELANSYLPILGMPISVQLLPYSEKKTGGVKDSISIILDGAGGGSYNGASQGERRRVDLAIMLALAEVAAGASGTTPGTLFLDEVCDGIDESGTGFVVDLVADLAKTRCVVLITHRQDLAEAIPAKLRVNL
jgi:DNA repair exonuclease SbcCD ATPase subunit